jgi:hypothetical protein
MTGPEHYLEAERLIELARAPRHGGLYGDSTGVQGALILADAQVHATLAQAAAAAPGQSRADELAWADATGTRLGGTAFGTS